MENPRYEINPAIAPVIILSFMDESERQPYLIKIQITRGATKQSKNIKETAPA